MAFKYLPNRLRQQREAEGSASHVIPVRHGLVGPSELHILMEVHVVALFQKNRNRYFIL
jgi:hypothetical protein